MDKLEELYKVSNPRVAQEKANQYLGVKKGELFVSTKKDKKYMLMNPLTNKWIHFGSMDYQDFTKHKDEDRRQRYLKRAKNIRGNWKENPYSPNNLSIHILW
jgi:hypothetical protein